MYARIENETIKVYSKLPSKYRSETMNVAGGFEKLSEEIHQQEGFYHIIEPNYNSETERLGTLYFDSENGCFTYTIEPVSAYEIAMRGWHHGEYSKRIIASSDLIDLYPSIAIWFQLNGLPMILNEDTTEVRLYLNEIKPQHQELFDLLLQAGEIQIENRPEEEDYL